ncbi:peptidase T [Lacticaseibacillus hulanensis]|uniref:peptidase T n=1 Tax=Lacticaseibacillus hulanensis TaxID=2493111 RepID=UPI000FDBD254|nr:peptidase T [Lacticaseibacillus hulanensis]
MNFDLDAITRQFVRYAAINTRSDASSTTVPSTPGQTMLARVLQADLRAAGLTDVTLLDNGFVTATVPATTAGPTIGWVAHLDTADFNSDCVRPQVLPQYAGTTVKLGTSGLVLDPDVFPELRQLRGQTLITTDGTTLLGADDKAGITAAVQAAAYLVRHPELPHGKVRLAFGPDEEIGTGADRFDVAQFAADFAYTLDNGRVGDLEYETFNAAECQIHIVGKSVHPGAARGQLINALKVAQMIDQALPETEVPERTANYEGFFLLDSLQGDVGAADMTYIVRDFDMDHFRKRCAQLQGIVDRLNAAHAAVAITTQWHDQYYNMGPALAKFPLPVDVAKAAYAKLGLQLRVVPFRGGTDGSKITALGLPTPNLFNGGGNFHGPYEYVTSEAMATLAETLVTIATLAPGFAAND